MDACPCLEIRVPVRFERIKPIFPMSAGLNDTNSAIVFFLLCAAARGARMLAWNARGSVAKSLEVCRGGNQERFSKAPPPATRPSLRRLTDYQRTCEGQMCLPKSTCSACSSQTQGSCWGGARIGKVQQGYIHKAFNALHVRYYDTETIDGQLERVQKLHRLGAESEKHSVLSCAIAGGSVHCRALVRVPRPPGGLSNLHKRIKSEYNTPSMVRSQTGRQSMQG